jgi:hypothetical protein
MELASIVRQLPSVPVAVLLADAQQPYAMFGDIMLRCPSVLPPFRFHSSADLATSLRLKVLPALERKIQEFDSRRREIFRGRITGLA